MPELAGARFAVDSVEIVAGRDTAGGGAETARSAETFAVVLVLAVVAGAGF